MTTSDHASSGARALHVAASILSSRGGSLVLDVVGCFVGDCFPAERLDEGKGHIDTGSDAGGGDDPVGNESLLALDGDAGVERGQEIERGPVGRSAAAGEEASFGQEQR